jgi:hypothetical protein
MSEEATEILYNPLAKVVLLHNPNNESEGKYVSDVYSIASKLRRFEGQIGMHNRYRATVTEFLEEKLVEGDGATHEELCELAELLDVEVTRSVSVNVEVSFDIDIDVPFGVDVDQYVSERLEFSLDSDGYITSQDINSINEN